MKFSAPVLPLLAALGLLCPGLSPAWLGIKSSGPRSGPPRAKAAQPALKAPAADTIPLSRQVRAIPAGYPGAYLGTLQGVRCFNCAPDLVMLNLGDSASDESAIVAMRIEVWNSIERPMKDRRIFDYDNRCLYFGHPEKDTAWVGGEWVEIHPQSLPCYPYSRRTALPHAPEGAAVEASRAEPQGGEN